MRALSLSLLLALSLTASACTARGHADDAGCTGACTGDDTGLLTSPDAQFPDVGDRDATGCFDPIDLVFVLDVSTSMTEEFARLRDGIASIFDAANALTTNHTFGLVVFVDDVLVVNGCSSFDSAASLQAEFDHWRSFCSTNGEPGGSPGSNSDCPENSLDALYAAATECTWRDGATHIVIHVTDDTFLQRPQNFGGFGGIPAEHTYQEALDALVAHQIHVGAFYQEVPMECGAGTSANTAQGFSVSYMGAQPIPSETMGDTWDIAAVRAGTVDMADSINQLVQAVHCAPF
jgi:hypothetical protein